MQFKTNLGYRDCDWIQWHHIEINRVQGYCFDSNYFYGKKKSFLASFAKKLYLTSQSTEFYILEKRVSTFIFSLFVLLVSSGIGSVVIIIIIIIFWDNFYWDKKMARSISYLVVLLLAFFTFPCQVRTKNHFLNISLYDSTRVLLTIKNIFRPCRVVIKGF